MTTSKHSDSSISCLLKNPNSAIYTGMAIEVPYGRRTEDRNQCYEQYSIDKYKQLGRFGLRVYSPIKSQIQERGLPQGTVVYSPGWAQGTDEVNAISRRLAQEAHVYAVATKLPDGDHSVEDMVPFRADVVHATLDSVRDITADLPTVICGYSRGSSPASIVAGDRPEAVDGVQFIAPTWFEKSRSASALAVGGVSEGFESLFRGTLRDRAELVRIGRHAVKEVMSHPLELRRDVYAIAQSSQPADLVQRLEPIAGIGVVAGQRDRLCPPDGVIATAKQIQASKPDRLVDIAVVNTSHLHYFEDRLAIRTIAQQIRRLISQKSY